MNNNRKPKRRTVSMNSRINGTISEAIKAVRSASQAISPAIRDIKGLQQTVISQPKI